MTQRYTNCIKKVINHQSQTIAASSIPHRQLPAYSEVFDARLNCQHTVCIDVRRGVTAALFWEQSDWTTDLSGSFTESDSVHYPFR